MMRTFSFAPDAPALTQLLAVSIHLLSALRKHTHLCLCVPSHVHQQLHAADYGQVLYDLLSAEYPDLDARLEIRVHPKPDFLILFTPPGARHEIP
jgi:hypothetical protein